MVDISVIFEIIIIRDFVFSRVSHGNMKVLIKGMVIVMEKILIVDDMSSPLITPAREHLSTALLA